MKVFCILENDRLLATHATEATALQSISLSHCNIQGVLIQKEQTKSGGWLIRIDEPGEEAAYLEIRPVTVLEEVEHL